MNESRDRSGLRPFLTACTAAAAFAGLTCDPLDTYDGSGELYVAITVQPVGGDNVNTVTCTFTGTSNDPGMNTGNLSEPIWLSSVWHSTHGEYNSQVFEWTLDPQTRTETVSKSAPAGMYLDKDFWLELFWEDDHGDHLVKSSVAQCRVP